MTGRRSETIRVAIGSQVVEVPSKAARSLRGALVGARQHAVARKFVLEGDEVPVVLGRNEETAVLHAVWACMQQGTDKLGHDLLPLRNALRADLERHT
jgi:hypothetical protein